jgi:hypothetical protein
VAAYQGRESISRAEVPVHLVPRVLEPVRKKWVFKHYRDFNVALNILKLGKLQVAGLPRPMNFLPVSEGAAVKSGTPRKHESPVKRKSRMPAVQMQVFYWIFGH